MKIFRIEIHGSFFNDAGWDYDPVLLPEPAFLTREKAEEYAAKVQSGEIEVDDNLWDRFQDPDNTVVVVEQEALE